MIYVGTSGFSYDDWVGPFYPENLAHQYWLPYYARHFKACELNFTYYRQPDRSTLKGLARRVPKGFLFTVKAYQKITHSRDAGDEDFREFLRGIEPLAQEGKLGCILAQFPYSFTPSRENRDYLKVVREKIPEFPVVVEFRNARWLVKETFDFLRENNLGFCCVDEPPLKGLIPPIAEATSDVAYVRFHGRNKEKWWEHEEAWQRYDYTYTREELQEWVPKIGYLQEKANIIFAFANNHWRGQAVDTARLLRDLLREEGYQVV